MRNKHILLIGRSGSGKSYLVKAAIKAGKLGKKILILDYQDEYDYEEVTLQQLLEGYETLPNEFILRYVPSSPEETNAFFRFVLALGDVTVIAEEVGDYYSNDLLSCMRRGRRRGVQVIALSQRPADVHKTLTSQAACFVVFYVEEIRDVEYIRKRFGDAAEIELKSLNKEAFECCVFGDEDLFDTYLSPN